MQRSSFFGEPPAEGMDTEAAAPNPGITRKYTTNSFYEDNNEVRLALASVGSAEHGRAGCCGGRQ